MLSFLFLTCEAQSIVVLVLFYIDFLWFSSIKVFCSVFLHSLHHTRNTIWVDTEICNLFVLFNQCSNLWQPFIWGAFYWNKAHILCQNWNHACWTRYFGTERRKKNVRNTLRTLPWLGSILVYNGFTWFSCGGKFTVRIMVIWFVWIDLKYCSIVWSMAR